MTDEHNHTEEQEVETHQEDQASGDPLGQVAGAMKVAAEAIKSGAGDASAAAASFMPTAGRTVSKTVYATCYYLSYGVVFPTLLVAGMFPKNNPVYHGMVDGGHAAKDSVYSLHERRAALKAAADNALAEAAVAAGVAPA